MIESKRRVEEMKIAYISKAHAKNPTLNVYMSTFSGGKVGGGGFEHLHCIIWQKGSRAQWTTFDKHSDDKCDPVESDAAAAGKNEIEATNGGDQMIHLSSSSLNIIALSWFIP